LPLKKIAVNSHRLNAARIVQLGTIHQITDWINFQRIIRRSLKRHFVRLAARVVVFQPPAEMTRRDDDRPRHAIQLRLSVRRDQRAVCSVPRAVGRFVCLATTPVPLRKTARSSLAAMDWPQQRQSSVCVSAAALRFGSVPAVSPPALHFLRSPTADRSLVNQHRSW